MTTTSGNNGRLCNQIIRNLAVSLIAEKNDLKVNYSSKDLITRLGINLFSGKNVHNKLVDLTDSNYFTIYNSDNINYNLNANASYFQTEEILNSLYNYLHTDKVKTNIIENNRFKKRYNSNNDVFIHIRLTDLAHASPDINYYVNAIKKIGNFDNLYIATDDKNHSIIKLLSKAYCNSKILVCDEIDTIHFGSTCKHIILSHGSFSAVIGYLSFFSTIYYPVYESNIFSVLFSIDSWIKCPATQKIKKERKFEQLIKLTTIMDYGRFK